MPPSTPSTRNMTSLCLHHPGVSGSQFRGFRRLSTREAAAAAQHAREAAVSKPQEGSARMTTTPNAVHAAKEASQALLNGDALLRVVAMQGSCRRAGLAEANAGNGVKRLTLQPPHQRAQCAEHIVILILFARACGSTHENGPARLCPC